jgi:hypothetical protein
MSEKVVIPAHSNGAVAGTSAPGGMRMERVDLYWLHRDAPGYPVEEISSVF